ncbi:MAG: acetyl-CoA synthetase [Candidatus Tectimicrobiota bacterium]|nr:MAG: acetyl-CoA synthetase [Candidatus Tectomicrobia bacterium]
MDELAIPETFNVATAYVDANIAAGRGARPAFYCGERQVTYQEVYEQVNRTGNALRALGVEIENRVMLLLPDCPEFVFSFFGAIKIGAVPVPVNTLLRPPDYRYLLNDSRAKVLIVGEAFLPQIEAIRHELRYLRHLVVVGNAGKDLDYARLLAEASPELEAEPTSKDDMAFWLYSSGSTGFPKGAVHLHHDMLYVSDLFGKEVLQITEDDRTFSAAKLFFAYGLGNNMYVPMRFGASAVLLAERPTPEAVFATITRYRPTLFFGVPTLYAQLLQVEDAPRRYDLSSLRLCVSAGEALPPELFRRWKQRFGLEICDVIGSTEALHVFIANRPGRIRVGSSGQVVPGFEAKIVDEQGREVPVGEEGTLWVRGDSTAPFYWNKHRKTQQTMIGEWLNTGDRFRRDADGYYWFVGRADDMLKVGGIWVSPIEVENTLLEHPAVLEAAVVGAQDQDQLVKPKAYVVLRQGHLPSPALEAELKDFVKSKIAPYKYPRWIEFVDALPKTATGKIQRFKLRQRDS